MTKNEYIIEVAKVVRSKSDCYKRQVGAVFVNEDYEILATGYNAPPRGFQHCDKRGDITGQVDDEGTCGNPCARNIHAEQNAIAQAAKRGTALARSILFCTYTPCVTCARLLVNIRVARVIVLERDKEIDGHAVLMNAGVPLLYPEDLKPTPGGLR